MRSQYHLDVILSIHHWSWLIAHDMVDQSFQTHRRVNIKTTQRSLQKMKSYFNVRSVYYRKRKNKVVDSEGNRFERYVC